MKKTLVVLCSWFVLIVQGATPPAKTKLAHEFYVSITHLQIDEEEGVVNAVFSTFPDDWERAMNALLEAQGQRYLALDSAGREALHERYLKAQWTISQPGVELEMDYLFAKQNLEKIELYVVFRPKGNETIDVAKKLRVENRVMADLFPSQENIVTAYLGDKRKTNSCREGNDYQIEFKF